MGVWSKKASVCPLDSTNRGGESGPLSSCLVPGTPYTCPRERNGDAPEY